MLVFKRCVLTTAALVVCLQVMIFFPTVVDSKAILGIDMGSLYMKVALVQRGAPLEIVTNLHSKRKTENMILFDSGTRFYGADASSLIARKPLKTPVQMSVMLGRSDEHPVIQALKERHIPILPKFNETRYGVDLSFDGMDFSPEELSAMVLTHAKEMTKIYIDELGGVAMLPKDCVLTVPSFATIHERWALMAAAKLADMNVLGLIDENTASALNFAMDKQYPEPQILLFYNLGASSLQVSVVKFFSYTTKGVGSKEKTVGALEVLSKSWDSTMGGQLFDHRIVEYLADTFNGEWNKKKSKNEKKDVRDIPRAMMKIRLQANKIKHVLSANQQIPIYIDSVADDIPLSTTVSRAKFEELCGDLLERAVAPVHEALKIANITLEELTGIELIGGGMRIPKVQEGLQEALGGIELGKHINSDESMALGAAFHGANISTAFRVRQVGLADINPFPITISLENLPEEDEKGFFGTKKKKTEEDEEEAWTKKATIFKSNGKLGVKKTIAFTHDKEVHCALDYGESSLLAETTEPTIERYNITGIKAFAKEMEEKELGAPKVSLQFELSPSGVTRLIKAEAAVEEIYTVEEQQEVDDDEDEDSAENATATSDEDAETTESKDEQEDADVTEEEVGDDENKTSSDGENTTSPDEKVSEEKKEEPKKKKKKTITVEKEKKRVHKRTLSVQTYYVGKIRPYSAELFEESMAKLAALDKTDKERAMLEESRNKLESYIYHVKNKVEDDEENIGKVSTEEQRAEVSKLAADAEDWMYEDGSSADLATTEDKYAEISTPAEKIFFRVTEMTDRPEAVSTLTDRLTKVETLMEVWKTKLPHITEEERADVLDKVKDVREWLLEKEEEQAKKKQHEDPAFASAEVPKQTKRLEALVSKLKKKPKPKPEKKNTTDSDEATNSTDAKNSTDGETETKGKEEDTSTDSKGTESDGNDGKDEKEIEADEKETEANEKEGETDEKETEGDEKETEREATGKTDKTDGEL